MKIFISNEELATAETTAVSIALTLKNSFSADFAKKAGLSAIDLSDIIPSIDQIDDYKSDAGVTVRKADGGLWIEVDEDLMIQFIDAVYGNRKFHKVLKTACHLVEAFTDWADQISDAIPKLYDKFRKKAEKSEEETAEKEKEESES